MALCGIIAEFNPFHNGHEYLIKSLKRGGNTVICALSGNFVQRGDAAVFSKRVRTECCLKAGADIVVEMPCCYSMSTAQNFALCGVWQLYNMGCEKIVFGSESGNIEKLRAAARILTSDRFARLAAEKMKSGITFAAARELAAGECGADTEIFKNPNDNLGVEYMVAALNLRLNIDFECINRQGVLHDSTAANGIFASATHIRELLKCGDYESAKKYIPPYLHEYIKAENIADLQRTDRAIIALLRTRPEPDFKNLPDISEGIENRLYSAVRETANFEELCSAVKTKRYTLARVRRLVLSAAIGFDRSFFMKVPPYTRVLGASAGGISQLKKTVSLNPVVVKAADIEKLDGDCKHLFESECRATDFYALAYSHPRACGDEYKQKFIKTEEHSND